MTYKQFGGSLIFYSKGDPVSIEVDVNQNQKIDPNLDRAYGVKRDGGICAQYVLSSNSSTFCGAAPSAATVSVQGKYYLFTIPISELTTNPATSSVRVQFGFYNEALGWTYYPQNQKSNDYSGMFTIQVDPGNL